jgi:ATP-dependent RNA helicase DDX24/MAK5
MFGLHPSLLAAVAQMGFAAPTPIQARVLPAALAHFKDIVGAAQTGSGKTLAFGLPVLHRLLERRERLGMDVPAEELGGEGEGEGSASPLRRRTAAFRFLPALILTPTRVLAMQVR